MDTEEQDQVVPNGFRLSEDDLRKLKAQWNTPAKQLEAVESASPLDVESLQQPQPEIKDKLIEEELIKLLKQRNGQRENIFTLAKWYCWTSLAFLIAIISIQIAGRIIGPNHHFSIFSGNELQIIVVGVFGQFVGLLYIITRSLYDDKHYKDIFKNSMGK